ncbi:MAG: LytTR family DNA-binding domain-containing protein [Saprospiraceae bacterium]
MLKSGALTHKVRFRDILFVEKDENYLVFQTTESKIYVRANMTEIFDYVPASQFCRIHKSFVVGLDHIHTFEVHQLVVGKYKIPIGASYREALLEKIKS